MTQEPVAGSQRLNLTQARDLRQCFGRHRAQTVQYAIDYCLHCGKLKSCVRASWRIDRQRRWSRDDWWPLDEAERQKPKSQPRTLGKPVNIA